MRADLKFGHYGWRLVGSWGAGGLGGGLGFEFDGEALSVGIDGGKGACAGDVGGGGVGVFVVARGLLGEVSGESGDGLLTLGKGDLNVGAGAVPGDVVLAGVERFAFDGDGFIELKRAFVGFSCESGGRKKQRRTEKCERKFREFHEIGFLSKLPRARRKIGRDVRGRVLNSRVPDLTR
jgi:hypothetical protein